MIQINPAWQVFLQEKETGKDFNFHISVQSYKNLRSQDIELAKTYLAESWTEFIVPEKQKILALIEQNLREEDIPLLNWIVEKNETDIAPIAHEILLRWPASTLSFKAAQLIENYTYYHLGFEVIEDDDIFPDSPWAKGFVDYRLLVMA